MSYTHHWKYGLAGKIYRFIWIINYSHVKLNYLKVLFENSKPYFFQHNIRWLSLKKQFKTLLINFLNHWEFCHSALYFILLFGHLAELSHLTSIMIFFDRFFSALCDNLSTWQTCNIYYILIHCIMLFRQYCTKYFIV